jgi:hypothetical protein
VSTENPNEDELWFLRDGDSANDMPGDNKIVKLESENAELNDKVKEQRFLIAFLLIFLVDVVLFEKFIESGTAIVVFATPQLIFLFIYAQRCGIEEVSDVVDLVKSLFGRRE